MKKLNVEHFLGIYKIRLEMQEKGITNPTEKGKDFTKKIVKKLSKMPLEEEIILDGKKFLDSKGNLIIVFPDDSA